MKKSFNIFGITVDDPINLSCYLKASNAEDEELLLYGEEEILVNEVENIDDASTLCCDLCFHFF